MQVFLGFYDNPVRRYELKQDDKKKLFVQICTFLYSVEEGFFLNNVSAFVLVKIKQITQNNPLFPRIILAMLSFAFTTE
jgi:hypothetical protein